MRFGHASALPDAATRRETLDFLRIDLEKLRGVSEIVSFGFRYGWHSSPIVVEYDTLDIGKL